MPEGTKEPQGENLLVIPSGEVQGSEVSGWLSLSPLSSNIYLANYEESKMAHIKSLYHKGAWTLVVI